MDAYANREHAERISEIWRCDRTGAGYRYTYPAPAEAKGFYQYGFIRKNDSAADFSDFFGLALSVSARGDSARFAARVTIVAQDARMSLDVSAPLICGAASLNIPFEDFPRPLAAQCALRYINAVEIISDEDFEIESLVARRRRGIWLDIPVRGKAGDAGEDIVYRGRIANCASAPAVVSVNQVFEGWESIAARIELAGGDARDILLAPYGDAEVAIYLAAHELIPPGGFEQTAIKATAHTGADSFEDEVSIITLRKLPHPYIYHTRDGWREVRDKIERYSCYQGAYRKYIETADDWIVAPPMSGRNFCYETRIETEIMCSAYAYALTGNARYAQKIADFFRYFADPIDGYPARKRGCSQSYVQEGHFFQHLALAYDIIYDAGALSEGDHAAIEAAFRFYMEMLDGDIRSGHISNWIISEAQGALYCALAIQDMDLIKRFAFGNGGLVEQFRHGVFNDGWWYECSVGYNIWVSSMMIHMARALAPFGYQLAYANFGVPYNRQISASMLGSPVQVRMGMYNEKWGGNTKNYACIKDMFDAPLPFLDSRGVLFGIADSDEKTLSGVHFGSTYDLAYTYYKDERYIPVIRRSESDPIFGHPEFDERKAEAYEEAPVGGNAFADNIGIMMLRSAKPGRKPSEQIQAVLRYGSHGYAHGHFDICQLLSVMRYGRSFYNPECCWWGYAHFLYKFYVQCSLTKNMVVVDDKMQIPAESRRILFKSGDKMQAAGVEVTTRWAYPPYGGMCYHERGENADLDGLRRRLQYNRCELTLADWDGAPRYGTLHGYTEPIRQTRVMAVLDDYIVLFDSLRGESEHIYDSLMQIRGFRALEGERVRRTRHTEQMSDNIVSDAQFITDCEWYSAEGTSIARFETRFGKEQPTGDRTAHNVPGALNMDVYTAWPPATEQMLGRVATDCRGYTIPLEYTVQADGEIMASGAFNGWILGRREFEVDLRGRSELVLALKQGYREDEIGRPVGTPQACFFGSAELEFADGRRAELGEILRENPAFAAFDNIDMGYGVGRDYSGGRVTIIGETYAHAIPASTIERGREGAITISLEGLNAVALRGCVGVDAFPGDEDQYRRTYLVRTRGKRARFITVIEPYEGANQVREVRAEDENSVTITLISGKRQTVSVANLDEGAPEVALSESDTDME